MKGKAKELAERQTPVWWTPAVNRWRDQTGIAHAVHNGGMLCGAAPYSSGGSFASPEQAGAQACKRCLKIIERSRECATSLTPAAG